MMKTFDVTFSRDREAVLARARAEACQAGIIISGTPQSGKISGHGLLGRYELHDDGTGRVMIDDKPFILPWSTVEQYLHKFFASA